MFLGVLFLVFISMSSGSCLCMDSPSDVVYLIEKLGSTSDDLEASLSELSGEFSIPVSQNQVIQVEESLKKIDLVLKS